MDALTFGTKYLLRGFNSKKEPICQIDLQEVLKGFEMDQKEFIDLCILCGCDYTHTIGGMGPVTAYKLMKEHQDIEGVLKKVEESNEDPTKKKKYIVPEKFLYEESRDLFINPDVIRDKEVLQNLIKFEKPAEEELKEWLVGSKGFTDTKVNNGLERLKKC
jgi:flap endonuclease-1